MPSERDKSTFCTTQKALVNLCTFDLLIGGLPKVPHRKSHRLLEDSKGTCHINGKQPQKLIEDASIAIKSQSQILKTERKV